MHSNRQVYVGAGAPTHGALSHHKKPVTGLIAPGTSRSDVRARSNVRAVVLWALPRSPRKEGLSCCIPTFEDERSSKGGGMLQGWSVPTVVWDTVGALPYRRPHVVGALCSDSLALSLFYVRLRKADARDGMGHR